MNDDAIQRLTVVGTGMIGPDLTLLFVLAGYSVCLVGLDEELIDDGMLRLRKNLDSLVKAEVVHGDEVQNLLGRIETTTDLSAAATGSDMVFEAIYEDLAVKQSMFEQLDSLCPAPVILASSTSGLSPNDISARMRAPERMLVTHFWNPPYLVPLVEVVRGDKTSQQTVELALRFLEKVGKEPVVLKKDILGHIGNRLQHALFREAIHLVETRVADPEDIDKVIRNSFGPRYSMIGPMEYMDATGIDLQVAIHSYLYASLDCSQGPQETLLQLQRQGKLGMKTGRGFYDWTIRDPDEMVARQNKRFLDRLKVQRSV